MVGATKGPIFRTRSDGPIEYSTEVKCVTTGGTVTGDVAGADEVSVPSPLRVIKAISVKVGVIDIPNELLSWDETYRNLFSSYRLLALIMTVLPQDQPMYRLPELFGYRQPGSVRSRRHARES